MGTPAFKLIAFRAAVKRERSGSRGPVSYPAITLNGHRGVSASSFCDGAIRFLEGRMPGSRGRKNHLPRDNLKRASRRKRSFSSLGRLPVGLTFWERQLLSWYIFKKVSRTDHRGRGGHKGERFLRESTSGYCFLCVLSVYSVRNFFWFWKDIKRIPGS